jgi:choline-sulfatase
MSTLMNRHIFAETESEYMRNMQGGTGMKLLMIDIDTLRTDHLGCYGYERNTSPVIDSVAREGICLSQYYCSDAPCLPSRAALFTGQFGFHTGIVGHGGTAADMRLMGKNRMMFDLNAAQNLPVIMGRYGMYPVSISSFADRHGAWWFHAGFRETYDPGKKGNERADEVAPIAIDWLKRNKARNDWFLHVHFWDPHTVYRTPAEFGNPFEDKPSSSVDWITEDVLKKHRKMAGCHSANDMSGLTDDENPSFPRQLGKIENLKQVRTNVDNYDCGIAYTDHYIGMILDELKEQGIYEDTSIIITSDHGENLGELGRYDEHGTADNTVTNIPFVIKWAGLKKGVMLKGLHYNTDLIPTLMGLLGKMPFPKGVPQKFKKLITEPQYDGINFSDALKTADGSGRPYLVVGQCAHVCQRSVIFDGYIYIRTYHDGYCLFDEEQLYDLKKDPHETNNLASENPELCCKAVYYMEHWTAEQMKKNIHSSQIDPMWTVIAEGGPFHVKGHLPEYLKRLDATGRSEEAERLKQEYPNESGQGGQ